MCIRDSSEDEQCGRLERNDKGGECVWVRGRSIVGQGVGRRLVEYGIRMFSVGELCVNEQNPQAVGFYSGIKRFE